MSARSISSVLIFFVLVFTAAANADQVLNGNTAMFGQAIAVQGNVALVGAPQSYDVSSLLPGAAYLYRLGDNGNWSLSHSLAGTETESADRFGSSVAADDNLIFVGAPWESGIDISGSGAVYIFSQDGALVQRLTVLYDGDVDIMAIDFGAAVAVNSGGDTLFVSAPQDTEKGTAAGAVYVFGLDTSTEWGFRQKVLCQDSGASDMVGTSVAVADDYLIVGAPTVGDRPGKAYIFNLVAGDWIEIASLEPSSGRGQVGDRFGVAVAMVDGFAFVGSVFADDNGGAVYVFAKDDSGQWNFSQKLVGSKNTASSAFGASLSVEGDYLIVGAPGATQIDTGSVYVFQKTGSEWSEIGHGDPINGYAGDAFGKAIALSGQAVFVGAPTHGLDTSDFGQAFVYSDFQDWSNSIGPSNNDNSGSSGGGGGGGGCFVASFWAERIKMGQ